MLFPLGLLLPGVVVPSMSQIDLFAQLAESVEYTDYFSRGVRPPLNECPRYDTKQADGKDPVMQDLLGIQSTPSLSSLSGLL